MRKVVTSLGKRLGLGGLIALYLVVMIFPLLYLFLVSVKPYKIMFATPPRFLFQPTFEFYRAILTQKAEVGAFLNSLVVSAVSTFFSVGLGALAAFAFGHFKFFLRRSLYSLFFLTRIYPPVTTLIPIYMAAVYLRILDTQLILVICYTGAQLAMSTWLMRAFMARLPKEVMESALIDGCSKLRMFFKLAIPMSRSGLTSTSILVFIFNWNEFLFALLLTSRNARTAPVAITSYYVVEHSLEWQLLAVMGIISLIPVVALLISGSKHLIQGLTLGAGLKE